MADTSNIFDYCKLENVTFIPKSRDDKETIRNQIYISTSTTCLKIYKDLEIIQDEGAQTYKESQERIFEILKNNPKYSNFSDKEVNEMVSGMISKFDSLSLHRFNSIIKYLLLIYQRKQVDKLNKFLEEHNFGYQLDFNSMNIINNNQKTIRNIMLDKKKQDKNLSPNVIYFENKNISSNNPIRLSDLSFKSKLHLIVLLWLFSSDILNQQQERKLLILDEIDCHLDINELKEIANLINNEDLIGKHTIKTIIISHNTRFSELFNSYIIKTTNGFEKKDETFKNELIKLYPEKCSHGYIYEFNYNDFKNKQKIAKNKIECSHCSNLQYLENFDPWKNIPMFSILTGVNGIGKTTLLKYFHRNNAENSLFISNFSKSLRNESMYDSFIIRLNNEIRKYEAYEKKENEKKTINCDDCNDSKEKSTNLIDSTEDSEEDDDYNDDNDGFLERKLKNLKMHLENYKGNLRGSSFWKLKNKKDFLKSYPIPNFIQTSAKHFLPILVEIWDEEAINTYLEKRKFEFSIVIKSEKREYLLFIDIDKILFSHKDTQKEIKLEDLSTGQHLLLTIYLWEFYCEKNQYNSPRTSFQQEFLLLIDEPDAHLHPSKLKSEVIDFFQDTLVKKMNMQVIVTTHNPCTIALAQQENVFVIYGLKEGTKKILNASESPIHPYELLSSGLTINSQHTVLVESEQDELYYKEINRQLYDLSIKSLDEKLTLFPYALRFLTFKPLQKDRSSPDFDILSKELENIVNEIKNEYTDIISKFKTDLESGLLNQMVERSEKKINKFLRDFERELGKDVKQLGDLKQYSQKIDDLKKIPSKYLEQIIQFEKDGVLKLKLKSLAGQFKTNYETNNNLLSESLIFFVQESNLLFNFDDNMLTRNYTFGILNRGRDINLEKKDFTIYTDTYGLENCIFDPLYLFLVLQIEIPHHALVKKIEEGFEKIIKDDESKLNKKPPIIIDWNYHICLDSDANSEKNLFLSKLLNFIIREICTSLGYEDEYDYQTKEFIQPNIILKYPNQFLMEDKETLLEKVGKLFAEWNLKEKFVDADQTVSAKLMLDYLIKQKKVNLLISRKLVQQFHIFKFVIRNRHKNQIELNEIVCKDNISILELTNEKIVKLIEDNETKNVLFTFSGETLIEELTHNFLEDYLHFNDISEYSNLTYLFLPNKDFETPLHSLAWERKYDMLFKIYNLFQMEILDINKITNEMIIGKFKLIHFSTQIKYSKLVKFKKLNDKNSNEVQKVSISYFNEKLAKIVDFLKKNMLEYIIFDVSDEEEDEEKNEFSNFK